MCALILWFVLFLIFIFSASCFHLLVLSVFCFSLVLVLQFFVCVLAWLPESVFSTWSSSLLPAHQDSVYVLASFPWLLCPLDSCQSVCWSFKCQTHFCFCFVLVWTRLNLHTSVHSVLSRVIKCICCTSSILINTRWCLGLKHTKLTLCVSYEQTSIWMCFWMCLCREAKWFQ